MEDATDKYSAAISRALESDVPTLRLMLLALYSQRRATLCAGSTCCLSMALDGAKMTVSPTTCRIVETDIPFEHAIILHYKWTNQANIIDGIVVKCVGFTDTEVRAVQGTETPFCLSTKIIVEMVCKVLQRHLIP